MCRRYIHVDVQKNRGIRDLKMFVTPVHCFERLKRVFRQSMTDVCLIFSLESFYNLPRKCFCNKSSFQLECFFFLIFSPFLSCCILGFVIHTSYLENKALFSLKIPWLLLFLRARRLFYYCEHMVFAKNFSGIYSPQITLTKITFYYFILKYYQKV